MSPLTAQRSVFLAISNFQRVSDTGFADSSVRVKMNSRFSIENVKHRKKSRFFIKGKNEFFDMQTVNEIICGEAGEASFH